MLQTNWKSTSLMAGISGVSAILLLAALVAIVDLALFTNIGIGSWLLLLLITLASSPLTVRVASHDGILRARCAFRAGTNALMALFAQRPVGTPVADGRIAQARPHGKHEHGFA